MNYNYQILRTVFFSLMCLVSFSLSAQDKTISGKVTDAGNSEPLVGVNIIAVGAENVGSITDIDGNYSIKVPADITELSFSFIGYTTQKVAIGSQSTINISLAQDMKVLDDVVVAAFGLKKDKKALGYAVTNVSGEDLTQAKETNVVNSLAGKVPGLQIGQSSNGIGGSSSVVIRGNTSLSGSNQALFVVDGVIVNSASSGTGAASGNGQFDGGLDYGSPIADLNPDDIESMTVLKGANAAALYGSQAANGVIVITTKKGSKNKGLGISYSSNLTFENVLIAPEFQNEYGQGRYDAAVGQSIFDPNADGSWGPRMTGQSLEAFDGEGTASYSGSADEFRDYYQTGTTLTNSISLDGGKEGTTYRIGYANLTSKGITPGSKLNRNTFNLRLTSDVTDRLTVDTKLNYIKTKGENRSDVTEGLGNTARTLSLKPRNISLSDLESRYQTANGGSNNWGSGLTLNPYYVANKSLNQDVRDRYLALVGITYKINDDLKFQVRGSQDYSVLEAEVYRPIDGYPNVPAGGMTDISTTRSLRTMDAILTYDKQVNDNFSVSAMVGGNYQYTLGMSRQLDAGSMIDPNTFSINNFSSKTVATSKFEKEIQSVFGSAQFGYKNAVFLELTARNDWSSTLPINNNSYFYPSATLSAVLTDLIDIDPNILTLAKIRASWAAVGNDTDAYNTRTAYNVSADRYNGATFFYLADNYDGATYGASLKNPELKPESTQSIELGTDLRFFNNKLGLDVTYYQTNTFDQILDVDVSTASGFQRRQINAGNIQNSGIEVMLNATPFDNGTFRWDMNVNFAQNRSKVVELSDEYGIENQLLGRHYNNTIAVLATKGEQYGDLQGTSYRRVNGQIAYDSEGLPIVDSPKKLGNFNPDFIGGVNNNFSYKGLSLGVLVDFKVGGDLYSFRDAAMASNGTSIRTLEGREYHSGGQGIQVPTGAPIIDPETGEATTLSAEAASRGVDPNLYWGRVGGIAEEWIYDASFVKLRQVTISYKLPSSIVEKTPFKSLRFGYVARNLAILSKNTTNFDPEASFTTSARFQGIESFSLPTTSSHGFQLSASF